MSQKSNQDDDEPGAVLSPDELDFTDAESVLQLEEGRFVISPSGTLPEVTAHGTETGTDHRSDAGEPTPDTHHASERTGRDPDPLRDSGARYGFRIAAKFDDRVAHHSVVSNDIVTTFEQLLVWYARGVDDGTPIEDVLGILLAEANLPVTTPTADIRRLADRHGLGPTDSIADLLHATTEHAEGMEGNDETN